MSVLPPPSAIGWPPRIREVEIEGIDFSRTSKMTIQSPDTVEIVYCVGNLKRERYPSCTSIGSCRHASSQLFPANQCYIEFKPILNG
jgi:hypothetical protein